MLFAASVSRLAVAQPENAADVGATSGSSNSATAPTAAPSAAPSAAAAPTATAASAAATPAAAANALAAKPEAAEAQPLAPEPAKAGPASAAPVPIVVENLPASGYPEAKVRGIVGGSLWFVMPGSQFPYMAPETSPNKVRVAISGYVWDDTSYARLKSGKTNLNPNMTRWYNQGVGLVRFTPSYTTRDGWFAQGNVETVANIEQDVVAGNIGTVYDAFVRAGKWNVFDITVGRFQGWEVYHYGMGLDYNTLERYGATLPNLPANTQIYGVSTYWDRPAFGVGDYALHFYPTDYLRFELLGQIGTQGSNVRGTRPVAILDLGYLKVKAGWEYGVTHNQNDGDQGRTRNNGFGGAAQFVINPYIEGGINGAIGYYDYWTDQDLPAPQTSTTTKSYGGFLNGRVYGPLMIGLGANETHWNNLLPNANPLTPQLNGQTDWSTHFQGFAAVQYSFWDNLFLKFVANYARFHYQDIVQVPAHPYTNKEWGGRLRMMFLF